MRTMTAKKPTKEQINKRYQPFKFRYNGDHGWFYLFSGVASFHQITGGKQSDVHGLSIRRLVNALNACGYITLFLLLPVIAEASEQQLETCGEHDPRCPMYSFSFSREKPKQVVIYYKDFITMLAKTEHKDKLLNQCMAERGILIKLNDENGTIKKLDLQQIEALQGEVESHRKLGETQEQIVQAIEQKLAELTGELTREKRLSRYKSEAFWMGVIGVGLWILN